MAAITSVVLKGWIQSVRAQPLSALVTVYDAYRCYHIGASWLVWKDTGSWSLADCATDRRLLGERLLQRLHELNKQRPAVRCYIFFSRKPKGPCDVLAALLKLIEPHLCASVS